MKLKYLPFFLILLLGCSSNKDKELFEAAQQKLTAKNFSEAIKDYTQLADEYPNSELAPKGLFESAKLYHSRLVPGFSKEASLAKAISYYRRVASNYETKEAEEALFMIGFVQANELYQADSAKISYESFLEKYPKSDLVPSVKLELENLGRSPEEILQNKLSK